MIFIYYYSKKEKEKEKPQRNKETDPGWLCSTLMTMDMRNNDNNQCGIQHKKPTTTSHFSPKKDIHLDLYQYVLFLICFQTKENDKKPTKGKKCVKIYNYY